VRYFIRLIPALAMLSGLLAPNGAHAAERYRLYSISCVPEIHYFSLRSVDLGKSFGDWSAAGADKAELLEKQHGLFEPARLQARPFACEPVPGIKLEISATYSPPSAEQCAGNGYSAVSVSVNGHLLETLGQINPCDAPEEINIVIDDLAYRACTTDIAILQNGAVQADCRSVSMPELRLN